MPFFLSFLLTLAISLDSQWVNYIEKFNENIDNQEHLAISVWGIHTLYYSSPDSIKHNFLSKIESGIIKSSLQKNNNLKDSIIEVNTSFLDESLLLFSLLIEEDSTKREIFFDNFYSSTSDRELYEINLSALEGKELTNEKFGTKGFEFYHFLVAFFRRANPIVSDQFFEAFSEYGLEHYNNLSLQEPLDSFFFFTLAKSLYERNRYQDMLALYPDLNKAEAIPSSSLKRDFFWGWDFAMYRLREIDKSLEIQREFTIPISRYIGDEEGLQAIYIYMGGYLYNFGKYREAEDVLLTSLAQSDGLSETLLSRLYNNLSLIYYKTGEMARYEEMQNLSLELAEKLGNYGDQIQIYRNLHIFHRKNRNWDLAARYLEEAVAISERTGQVNDRISNYISQAVFEDQMLGNRDKAFQKLEEAQAAVTKETETRLVVRVMDELSSLYMKEENWEESKKIQEQIRELATSQSDSPIYLDALVNLAKIHYQTGNYSEARESLREFKTHDITVVDFHKLVLARTIEANVMLTDENYEEADRLFSSVSELVLERARNTSEIETGFWSVEPEYLYLFNSYADHLIDSGNPEEALLLLDRFKTINDASLIQNPLVTSSHLSEEDLAAERRIRREMDRVRKQIFSSSGEQQLSLQNELSLLAAQKRQVTGPANYSHDREIPSVWSIQRALNGDEMVVHFTEVENYYYLSLIQNRSIEIKKLERTPDVSALFEDAIESVVSGRPDLNLLYRVGEYLGVSSFLDGTIGSVILIPDGYLHQLPMDIIPVRNPESSFSYGSAQYVVEHVEVRTLNSLIEILQKPVPADYLYDFIGFGISDFNNEQTHRDLLSLPKAPEEVRNISERLHRLDRKNTFINGEATASNFRQVAGSSRILHLATHSEVYESDPLFSQIHFTIPDSMQGAGAGNPENEGTTTPGRLFAYELFDLNLQNQLVMLNSCESGAGRSLQGSGIMGMSRALRYAGVHSLVLNAWSVNDQLAAEFANKFYYHLNRGESKSRALQLTKIEFIKEKNANPHTWGSYILNGDNRPVVPSMQVYYSALVLSLFFFSGLIFLIRTPAKKKTAA